MGLDVFKIRRSRAVADMVNTSTILRGTQWCAATFLPLPSLSSSSQRTTEPLVRLIYSLREAL
ncbi:hypothetical protein MYCODSM44623_05623 (plasmid) [Mycobacterium intracellulare subsp. chimaera]|uniref:Uncharacterized protein n=1 Tax=Mycobacterium intracellulare subsp. chimaera TaxID=222805 RepID=A0A7U5MRA4_MYCIT|nr:hypothetical protein MYCODSM44623_03782 [Mycobacterium intracellulare subsp. chimaera]ASL12297.1 hypothetical protein MYCODSM44623_05623 [Mycobacterium intracellulare subsp. chimaera]ASL16357.1 hypothetical protein MYCOZU2_03984 [Mycobacterium intracellulare subsp. chimaera]ASL18284.1 hypothetical protein MYCOZU2_05939 [Mycobacterium intracellulare subsp. chimaera]ORV33344.1 hypothetical protein AWB97_09970 [Mycobacterium intracellulare subsp. chimaera]